MSKQYYIIFYLHKGQRSRNNGKWRVHSHQDTPRDPDRTAQKQGTKVKVRETPIFIPYTRESVQRKALQSLDDTLGECMGSPSVRFVERCGEQILVALLGTSNP